MKPIALNNDTTTKAAFAAAISDSRPTLFLCYASWCGHCIRFKPIWEEVKQNLATNKEIHVVEVEADLIELLPTSLRNIRGFPTLQIVQKGKVKKEYHGERDRDAIVKFAKEQVTPKKATAAALKKKKVKPA